MHRAVGGKRTAAAAGSWSPEKVGGAAAGCGWRAAGAAGLLIWWQVEMCRAEEEEVEEESEQ